jgi:hypothetical protein
MKTNDTHESVSRIAGRGLVLVSLLAVALAFAASSFAQTNAGATPKVADAKAGQPSANSLAPKTARAPKGTGEGIQIHGWWTIEIRNRDGSVAKHVEFENALFGDGPGLLSGLLFGSQVAGSWELDVGGSPSPCLTAVAQTFDYCAMVTAGSGYANWTGYAGGCTTTVGAANPQPFCYATLAPSLTGAFTPDYLPSSLTLSGQAYVDTSTSISFVQSSLVACLVNFAGGSGAIDNAVSPSVCYSSSGSSPSYSASPFTFSQYDFYPALSPSASCGGSGQPLCEIPVQAGQVIAASVTFSFSSPSGEGQSATPALAHRHPILRAPASTKPTASTPVTQ